MSSWMISLGGWDSLSESDFVPDRFDGVAKNDESFVCAGLAATFCFFADLVVAEDEDR